MFGGEGTGMGSFFVCRERMVWGSPSCCYVASSSFQSPFFIYFYKLPYHHIFFIFFFFSNSRLIIILLSITGDFEFEPALAYYNVPPK